MTTTRLQSRRRTTATAGFSLTELMIAIGIFAVGAIAVASIFPAAIMMQKATVADMNATHFATSAQSLVMARGFDSGQLGGVGEQVVASVPPLIDPTSATSDWQLVDRSFNTLLAIEDRRVFWVPLFYDGGFGTPRDWWVYLFIVRGKAGATYTKVPANDANPDDYAYMPAVRSQAVTLSSNRFLFTNSPRLVRVGDRVLSNDGIIYQVVTPTGGFDMDTGVEVDGAIVGTPTTIWYARPDDQFESRTFVDILLLKHVSKLDDAVNYNNLIR